MDVFITGGTGYIGRAVIAELTGAGYRVVALNRSPEKAPALEALGAIPHPGDLNDGASYAGAARAADAVIHAALDYGGAEEGDRIALDALLEATADRQARLVYTSGCWALGDTGEEAVGDDAPTDHPAPLVAWRVPHEARVIRATGGARAASVIRPGIVYGRSGSLTAPMFETALQAGAAEHVGEGENHWSLIHVDDLARLYRVVIEEGATGVVQAVDDVPLRLGRVAAAASEAAGAGGATRPIPIEVARQELGPMADALCLDQCLSAPAARALGWAPTRASFVASADEAFAEWREAAGA